MTFENLLKLHYALPLPLNRYLPYVQRQQCINQLSPDTIRQLFKLSPSRASEVFQRLEQLTTFSLTTYYEQQQITPISFTDPRYPKELHQLIDPPTILYAKGDYNLLFFHNRIAIIGSRKATNYSTEALQLIVPPLIEGQAVIVSGMAKGADTMAHQATIFYGGKTIAVLGHGFRHCYPKENECLAQEIAKNHLLLTEFPPYVPPAKWTFPMRNRLISGLSNAVIITEAAEKSGTMSTVEHALDHGKDIYAVPGAVTSLLSMGPNKLIAEGAKPIWHGFQVELAASTVREK